LSKQAHQTIVWCWIAKSGIGRYGKGASYDIPKDVVVKAWKQVRTNHGSAGIDDESTKDFETDLRNNLYKIWNCISTGSYFLPSVKFVKYQRRSEEQDV
jgi:RNA-directed DNA polymerase